MTISSPGLADLNADGVPDIVFGTGIERIRMRGGQLVFIGEPETPGHVVAVSGDTNEILWEAPHPGDAFTTPRFADLNGDGVPDVVMGGREGALSALSGRDGSVLWQVNPGAVADTPNPYNFFTPALTSDLDGDGVPELVVTYGGDDLRLPQEPRDPGYVVVLSGADGRVLGVQETPDGAETYASPVVYERPDGCEWVIFGTGGETHGGAAYRAPVSSILDGTFADVVEELVPPGESGGVMAPPTLLDLTGDGELDIIITTFDGRMVAVGGGTGMPLWAVENQDEETYHSAAPVRLPDGGIGLFVSWGMGTFPRYVATVHRLHDAEDGGVLFEYMDPYFPAGAPLAVDLTGNGSDEVLFFSVQYPSAEGARAYILDVGEDRLIARDMEGVFWSTPVIADPRGMGSLEMIGVSWRFLNDPTLQLPELGADWEEVGWQLFRLELGGPVPERRSWAGYMGTGHDGHFPGR
jgi:hypothetical protein